MFSLENCECFENKPKRPSVYILAPPEHKEGDKMTLTCYVKDFYPKEVFVSWLADDEPVTLGYSYNTSLPIQNDKYFSVYSQLTVDYSEWKSGTVFSCVVYHESIDEKIHIQLTYLRLSGSPFLNQISIVFELFSKHAT
uniref:Ig-like domain-containing protein n=1 Tax=Sinocyclocheilus rhinocerous TaxID=307959 RepID=A0A673M509_9TELE